MNGTLGSKKELLLAAVPGEANETILRYAMLNGRRIVATGEGPVAGASDPTRVAVFSLDSYFEQVELAAASAKLLPLVARRHIDAELVFDDSAYRLRTCARSKRERTITTDIAAIPNHDLDAIAAMLPLQRQPCLQMVPLELAIAALVNKVSSEPVIVFWERAGTLISLLVAKGMVQSRMRERVAGDSRDASIRRSEAGLRSAASRAGSNGSALPCLYTGELADDDTQPRDKAEQAFAKKLGRLFHTGRRVPDDAVLRDPELYGLPFVAGEWNFLEAGYRTQVQSWLYARPVAAAAILTGILTAVYGGTQHLRALAGDFEFDQQRAHFTSDLTRFERMRPSDEDMAAVRNRLQVRSESLNEVRLDRMLDWLTHLVPEGVVISALEMGPTRLPRDRRQTGSRLFPPGQKPFDLTMEITLAETALDAAEASAAEVVRRLSQRLHMLDSRLQVPAPEPGVRRNVVLVVRAQAHAVNFS
jgi:hypothetical protein